MPKIAIDIVDKLFRIVVYDSLRKLSKKELFNYLRVALKKMSQKVEKVQKGRRGQRQKSKSPKFEICTF